MNPEDPLAALRRELLTAAHRQAAPSAATAAQPPKPWRVRRRGGAPLLAAAASLLVAGGAIAAVATGALDTGKPVPRDPRASPSLAKLIKPGTSVVLPLRVDDPDGDGPPWGLAVFDVVGRDRSPKGSPGHLRCLRTGRVQGGRLGVVGRDGVFGNDGKFHPARDPFSLTGICSRLVDGQTLQAGQAERPIPASGFTDSPGTPAAGCLKHPVQASSSPATRRRLGDRQLCDPASLRLVRAGFAGRLATRVTLANDRVRLSMTPGPGGAYLFVVKPSTAGTEPLRLTASYRDGTTCQAPLYLSARGHKPTADPNCLPPPGF